MKFKSKKLLCIVLSIFLVTPHAMATGDEKAKHELSYEDDYYNEETYANRYIVKYKKDIESINTLEQAAKEAFENTKKRKLEETLEREYEKELNSNTFEIENVDKKIIKKDVQLTKIKVREVFWSSKIVTPTQN